MATATEQFISQMFTENSYGKGDHDFLKYLFKEDSSIVLCNPVQLLSCGQSPWQS